MPSHHLGFSSSSFMTTHRYHQSIIIAQYLRPPVSNDGHNNKHSSHQNNDLCCTALFNFNMEESVG
ncbi:uncharacterized protein DS421_7g212830 [Arachis hypogaea]|nr:uncharacterized protein DS421_7g212830 [Arachis hypogaea]